MNTAPWKDTRTKPRMNAVGPIIQGPGLDSELAKAQT